MKIIMAKNSGFCFGVKNAIDIALKNAREHTYTYGDIIHNEFVIDKLKKQGINSIEDIDQVQEGTIIIRSHGASKEIYDKIKNKGLNLIDATCPFVVKIHDIVNEYYHKGYQIVIIGESSHPEVIGINGWCNSSAIIIDENYDLSLLKKYEKLCFVSQTTFQEQKYLQIYEKIVKQGYKTVEIFKTICYTTSGRQNEAKELAQKCDAVLVIGSKKSSNTNKLLSISKLYLERSFLIEKVDDLKNINFSTNDIVGIIAGASTPDELIMEVKEYMSQGNFKEANVSSEFEAAVNETLVSYKVGKQIKGQVISADENGIKVVIGGKNDGFIPKDEACLDGNYNPDDYKEGDVVVAKITANKDQETGCVLLSKKAVDAIKEADKMIDLIRNGEVFDLVIEKSVKGGLTSRLGSYKVFIPASQVKERFVKDLTPFVGKKLSVTVLEIDDEKHKIVASHRKVVEEQRKEKEEIFWTHVVPNVVVSGVVKRTTNFGAFVSVDGFDCLAHIVDLSWNHIKSVEEVLTVGKTYDFLVLSADREKNRVSLGYKQLQPHPFVVCMEKHPIGSTTKGKVVSIVPFGVFVEIEPHIEGLVHVSEVAHNFVKDINEAVKVGDEVDVQIINYDEVNRKINLSMKACIPVEEKPAEEVSNEEKPEQVKKTVKKSRPKVDKDEEQGNTEWSEESTNNPFADLLKDLNV